MNMRRIFSVVFILFFTLTAVAQVPSKRKAQPVKLTKEQASAVKKEANDLFKSENYRAALELYTKLVNYDPEDVDFNYRLGMCYMNSNSIKGDAVEYFVKAADKKDAPKDTYFQMGKALLNANLFDEAIEAFDRYKEVNNGKLDDKLFYDQNAEYVYNAKEYVKKPLDVTFINPGKMLNTEYPDYAPVCMALDTVVFFTSNRKGNSGGIIDGYGEYIPDIYYSSRIDTNWTKPKNLGINVNSEFYDISTGMTTNGDKLLIYKENAEAHGDIFVSSLVWKRWEKAEILDSKLSTRQEETGACMSNDGKRVFFAADMKGSLGGKDIWMIEKTDDGKWTDPVNLGPAINTPMDEDNPTLWHDGKTLFFASKGHTSMGGYDIFMSVQPSPEQEWSKPFNIGYPLNTTDDNLYFALSANARSGYISAVTAGGMGDLDIIYFSLKEPLIKHAGTLFRARIQSPEGLPAKDALCSVVKPATGEVLSIMSTNGANSEIFILLPPGSYKLKARSARMGRLEEDLIITGEEGEKGIFKTLTLEKNPSAVRPR